MSKRVLRALALIFLSASLLTLAIGTQSIETRLLPAAASQSAIEVEEAPLAEWNQTYGGYDDEYVFSVDEASDGGYVMAGATHSYGIGIDAWLVKTYSNGTRQWEQYYGGMGYDYASCVQQANDSGYILAGGTDSFSSDGSREVWLVKTDAAGSMQWTKTFGVTFNSADAHSVQQTSDGGYIVAATYTVSGNTFWLIKTDAAGNMVWNTQWGGNGSDIAYFAQETTDGGYIAAGSTTSWGAMDGVLVKTYSNGAIEWNKTYGEANSIEQFYSIQQTYDGGYVAVGYSNSSLLDDDFWLVKVGPDGSLLWSRTFGGLDDDWGSSVQQTSDGGFVIAGSTYSSGDSSPDYMVVKTDGNGNEEWRGIYGTSDTDQAQSIHETKDGGYVVAGYTYYSGGGVSTDGWLLKIVGDTDKDGLRDTWERKGIDYDKDGVIDLVLPGADWKHKDLFVEVDYMTGHDFDGTAKDQVIAAFRNAPIGNPDGTTGITLHVDIDEQILHQTLLKIWDDYDTVKASHFGFPDERASPNSAAILGAKKLAYRYCLFIHNQQEYDNDLGSWVTGSWSGACEWPGPANDFVVSLGSFTDGKGSVDEQAGSFMHELGHALGLDHGGGDGVNYKPNYLSVMNYAFQFPDSNPLRPLDYSRVQLPDLDEAHLNEPAGIGAEVTGQMLFTVYSNATNQTVLSAGFAPIDWNGNGQAADGNVRANVNNFPQWNAESPADETLHGYDDWNHLNYSFQIMGNFADSVHGMRPPSLLTWEIVQSMREAVKSIHDIAVLKLDIPKPMIPTGSSLNLSVTLMNQGNYNETINATVYANATPIGSRELILEGWNIRTINLTAATSGFSDGNYMLSAYVSPVAGETDIGDNTCTYGTFTVASGWVDWNQTYGESYGKAYSVCQTTEGGFAVAGEGYYDNFMLVKTDSEGIEQWKLTYGFGPEYDEGAYSVRQTLDGGYILAGYTDYSTGHASLLLVKTDSEGNITWSKTYGGDDFNDMYEPRWVALQTGDGGYITAGSRRSYPGNAYDMWLLKTDSEGNELWNETYEGGGWEYAYCVCQTTDEGYILGGYTSGVSEGSHGGAFIVKTDAYGNEQWNKTFADARAYFVAQTADEGYVFAGVMYYYGEQPGGDFWLLKTDSGGNTQWDKTYASGLWAENPGGSVETAYCVQQTSDNGYILAGIAQAYGTDYTKAWFVKTDASGTRQNELAYSEDSDFSYGAYSVQQTLDDAYVAAGYKGGDFLLLKFSLLVIPELQAWTAMLALIGLTLTTAILFRKRKQA